MNTYTTPSGNSRIVNNWRFKLIQLADNSSYIEICGTYKGKRNFTSHVHKDVKEGIYIINPRKIKIPAYALTVAKEMLGIEVGK